MPRIKLSPQRLFHNAFREGGVYNSEAGPPRQRTGPGVFEKQRKEKRVLVIVCNWLLRASQVNASHLHDVLVGNAIRHGTLLWYVTIPDILRAYTRPTGSTYDEDPIERLQWEPSRTPTPTWIGLQVCLTNVVIDRMVQACRKMYMPSARTPQESRSPHILKIRTKRGLDKTLCSRELRQLIHHHTRNVNL